MTSKLLMFIILSILITSTSQNTYAGVYTEDSHYVNRCITFVKDDKLTKDGVNIVAIITSPLIDVSDPNHTERRVILPDQCLRRKEVMPSQYDTFGIYSTLQSLGAYAENPADLVVEVKNVTGEHMSNDYKYDEEVVEYSYAGIIDGKPKFYRSKIVHRFSNSPKSSENVRIFPNPYANTVVIGNERKAQYQAKLLPTTPTNMPTVVQPTIQEIEVVYSSENTKQLSKSTQKMSNPIMTWLCQVFGKFIKSCNQK